MKTSFLMIGCAISLLFARLDEEDSWTVVLEQEGITTATVDVGSGGSEDTFYYATESGVFRQDSQGAKMLTGESDGKQPEGLLNTKSMILSNLEILPAFLYAATEEKLYSYGVRGKGPYDWREIYSAESVEIIEMVATTEGVFVLSEDNRLFNTKNDTLTEITLPEGTVTGFDIITPIAIGQERLVNQDNSAWVLFECSNGFLRQYMLFALPLNDLKPISMGSSVQETSTYLYGETGEFDFVKAITKGHKVDLQAYSQYLPTEGNIDLLFPSGTEITDVVLFDRIFPVYQDRLETYTPDILCITTSIGSYAIGLRELMALELTQAKIVDLDATIVLADEIPATQAIHTQEIDNPNKQYVINEEGISVYTTPFVSPVLDSKSLTTSKAMDYAVNSRGISLSLPAKESGKLSLLNVKGQELSSVDFQNAKSVTLSNNSKLSKGVYLLKLQTGSEILTEKLTIQ